MTNILTLIDHHAELHCKLDALYAAGGDAVAERCPIYKAVAREQMALAHRVIATRAATKLDAAAKQAFVERLEDVDLRHLLAAILELDADATIADAA